jgi:hypothetical protein
MEEYKKWLAEQKSEYLTLYPEKGATKNAADSVGVTNQVSQVLPVKK